jgi:hypothetical protein
MHFFRFYFYKIIKIKTDKIAGLYKSNYLSLRLKKKIQVRDIFINIKVF